MLARIVLVSCVSCLAVLATAGSADAFGRRGGGTTVCWTPCPPCPPPCHPCDSCGVFRMSLPPVNTKGQPVPTVLRQAHVNHGVIVQVDFPSDKAQPTGWISLKQKGPGEFRYVGYNTCEPGPAGHARYSVYLCPTKAGENVVDVVFALSDGSSVAVPFGFKIDP